MVWWSEFGAEDSRYHRGGRLVCEMKMKGILSECGRRMNFVHFDPSALGASERLFGKDSIQPVNPSIKCLSAHRPSKTYAILGNKISPSSPTAAKCLHYLLHRTRLLRLHRLWRIPLRRRRLRRSQSGRPTSGRDLAHAVR